jgi:feruloyl esterase
MKLFARITALAVVAIVSNAPAAVPSAPTVPPDVCTSLAEQRLPDTTITTAQPVTTGIFTPPGGSNAITNLPPFCRVVGVIRPTTDSRILFEVWLPSQEWNGKFAGVGNGGWAGTISYGGLAEQVRRRYASASTNTGHEAAPGQDMAKFAFDHPEQLTDFAYRAHHETTLKAKALVQAFYGEPPAHAYWFGCSSGGYEGLMEAQRFPADFDGIVAGAPANNFTRLMAGDLDATLAVLKDPAANLPPAALGLLYRRVLAACDRADGVVDGVLNDPRQCRLDPGDLVCGPSEAPGTCLTAPQVEAARRIYRGPQDPTTGAQLYPGLSAGSEPFWPNRDPASPFPISVSYYKWLVFGDPGWDWRTFDFSNADGYKAFLESERKFAPILNATNPDLREFRQHGGKLLQYHGWSDQLIAARHTVEY